MKFLEEYKTNASKYEDVKEFYTILEKLIKEGLNEDVNSVSPFFKPNKEWFEKIEKEREILFETFPELMTYQEGGRIKKKFLYEGLIKTFSIDETKKILQSFAGLDENDFDYKERQNTFSLYFDSKNLLRLNEEQIVHKVLNNILRTMNIAGWFISNIYDVNVVNSNIVSNKKIITKISENDVIDLIFKCETAQIDFQARYSQELDGDQIPKFVYHVTSNLFINKILKIGLNPKTKSKKGMHPTRIYLAKNYDDALLLGGELFEKEIQAQKTYDKKDKITKLFVLKINLQDFEGRLFVDDMARGSEKEDFFKDDSLWTNNNIDVKRISIFSEFDVD